MKASLLWLRQYLDLPADPGKIADMLTALGLEVEGQEAWESVPGGLAGLVVGRVLTCVKHPGADRLSLTTVDVGQPEPVQIVCGAPNVAAGQYVPVATVGATLYPSDGESFKIKRGKIRGEVSEGMICAEDEIGVGESHAGIMVLEGAPAPGTPLSEVLPVTTDTVFEIGLTPNRSDATSHRGVANDLRAYLTVHEDLRGGLRESPFSTGREPAAANVDFTVEVLSPELAPRYAGVVLTELKIGPSPDWLRDRLAAIGVRSINNVVDATNYILHDVGQPLHAFDLDRLGGRGIRVRTLPQNTPFVTLDGLERKLDAGDLVICDAEDQPKCLAGVFGGLRSGVNDRTTSVFLESAYFEPRSLRRTASRHDLLTDAARTFEKGVDPNRVVTSLQRAVSLLAEVAGARVSSEVFDLVHSKPTQDSTPLVDILDSSRADSYSNLLQPARVRLSYGYLSGLAGLVLPKGEVRKILLALDFEIVEEAEDALTVDVPTDRADVTRPADVVEEILRVYGYDNVPLPSRITFTPTTERYPSAHGLRRRAAEYLLGRGLDEAMGLSLVPTKVYEALEPERVPDLVRIHNTSTVELDAMRADLIPTGLQAIAYNEARQQRDLQFFEFGRGYAKGPVEREQVALWATGARHDERHWSRGAGGARASYGYVRGLLTGVLASVGLTADGERGVEAPGFAYAQEITLGDAPLGHVGRIAPAYLEYFDTKSAEVYAALVDWDAVQALASAGTQRTAREISRFPRVQRDLAVVVNVSVTFGRIAELAREPAGPLVTAVELFDVYEDAERLGAGKRSYAIRFTFERLDRTLKDKEVDRAMAAVTKAIDAQPTMEVRR